MNLNLTLDQIVWIERTADIEIGKCLNSFNMIEKIPEEKRLEFTNDLVDLHTFLKTLIAKLEITRNDN